MAVRPVLRMGHPLLREVARPLSPDEITSPEVQELIPDMVDTLHHEGGIGLAAPQIAEPIRLAIIEIAGGPTRYGELKPMPLTVYINPEIRVLDTTTNGYWEGCLSIPGLRGWVERPRHIEVSYSTVTGERATLELEGFLATVFQHEFDHLDGKLFVDRVTDTTKLSFEQEFEAFLNN